MTTLWHRKPFGFPQSTCRRFPALALPFRAPRLRPRAFAPDLDPPIVAWATTRVGDFNDHFFNFSRAVMTSGLS